MTVPPRSSGTLDARAQRSPAARAVMLPLQAYIHRSAISGGLLIAAAAAALLWANSPWSGSYQSFWGTVVTADLRFSIVSLDLKHWINDGLMTLFFFVIGLQVKREIVSGELSEPRRAALPVAAAIGGMLFPSLTYVGFNLDSGNLRGWAIPAPTDVAFALAVLALLGDRVPSQMTAILLTFAVADDIGSIAVIAVFFTSDLSFINLGAALLLVGLAYVLFRTGVRQPIIFIAVGVAAWLAMFQSGVHATLAGVAMAAVTPTRPLFSPGSFYRSAQSLIEDFRDAQERLDCEEAEYALGRMEELVTGTEPLHIRLERMITPWVSYVILPIFALANAGLAISGKSIGEALMSPVTLGVVAGLVLANPVGIFLFSWLAVKSGIAELAPGLRWRHVLGLGLIAGVGFTVALFMIDLAFAGNPGASSEARLGVLIGSLIAASIAYAYGRVAILGTGQEEEEAEDAQEVEAA